MKRNQNMDLQPRPPASAPPRMGPITGATLTASVNEGKLTDDNHLRPEVEGAIVPAAVFPM